MAKKKTDKAEAKAPKEEKVETPITPEEANSLTGIPGVGPVSIGSLNREGVFNGLELVFRGATFLKDVTGMDRAKAADALKFLRQRLEKAGFLREEEMTATQANEVRHNVKRVMTGCKAFDGMMGGGIECGSMTEVYGENGSGKTQLSHTSTVQALRPLEDGGLKESDEDSVLYIDTENTFRPERIISILAGRGLVVAIPEKLQKKIRESTPFTSDEREEYDKIIELQKEEAKKYTDRVTVQRALNAYDLFDKVQKLFHTIPEKHYKLVVVDSIVAPFRAEYLGRGNISAKFQLLNATVDSLKKVAELYSIPVIGINQIYHSPEEQFGNDPDQPYGGNIVGHNSVYRIKLWKSGRKHKARIIKSPHQDNLDCEFDITDAGISDLE